MRPTFLALSLLTVSTAALAQDASEEAPSTGSEEAASTEARLQELEKRLEDRDRLIELLLEEKAAAKAPATEAGPGATPASGAPATSYEAWAKRPTMIPYQEGMIVPEIDERKRVPRLGAIGAGAGLLGAGWMISTLVASLDMEVDEADTLTPLYIPVVGPWIGMITDGTSGDLSPAGGWGLAMLGVSQAVGVGVLSWGATHPRDTLVKRPFGVTSVGVAPTEGGATATVSGRF